MKKTLAAVAAGLLILAAAPAFAAGGCGSYIQSVDSGSGSQRVAQSDQVSTPTTQTATTQTATTQTATTVVVTQ